ncbi:MAG: VOC family protein [Pseudomonadota bacterium]
MPLTAQITPFVLVPDLEAGIAFFEALGLACTFRGTDPGYAFLRCDGGGIRLLEDDRPEARAASEQHMVYVDVADVDALWAEVEAPLAALGGRLRAPFDQPYGQREFHAIAPGGTLVLVGQGI